MAIGDIWDVSPRPGGAHDVTEPADIPSSANGVDKKVRLGLSRVFSTEAKHRGGRRRASAEKHASIAIAELDDVDEALRRRNEVLVAAMKRTQELYIVTDQRQIFRLASADLFVERAQFVLAQRARGMWRAGIVATVSAVALLIGLSAFLVWRSEAISSRFLAGNQLTLGLVEMLGATAAIVVAVRYLITLSRSFFHENVSLVARQHALGFGRLYVYTNPDAIRLKDLQDAFGLDLESTPIFLDIKSKETADTLYSRVTQDLGMTPGR